MSEDVTDTIVAAATPPGRGGVGIVRISGAATQRIAAAILGELPAPRRATFAAFRDADQQNLDAGIVLFFPAPHSYTGEDVVEFQGHGGPVILEALIARALQLGARRAGPGEFTQRAFLNDKLDLAQAEAVADLIDAGSRAAARAAMRSLQGEFSAMVQALTQAVIDLRVQVEAAIDFPEEEIDFLADPAVAKRLDTVRRHFDAVERSAGQGRLLRDGMTVVLAGAPNAGKSSLLNRLAGYDAAIVTAVPGTTRDVLRERIHIDGMPLHILDTAGLRAAADVIEEEGIRRAQAEMARADRVLFVIDAAADPQGASLREHGGRLPDGVPVTVLFNKSDLAGGTAGGLGAGPAGGGGDAAGSSGGSGGSGSSGSGRNDDGSGTSDAAGSSGGAKGSLAAEAATGAGKAGGAQRGMDCGSVQRAAEPVCAAASGLPQIRLSALTGEGLEELRAHLKACMGYHSLDGGSVSARQRHLEALARARAAVEEAARVLSESRAGELVAQELRRAQQALDEISGEFTSEDLLGRIFSSFCIGK